MGEPNRWDEIYAEHGPAQLSWTEAEPATSLRLLSTHADPARGVIDVGAGRATLADHLLVASWRPVVVLDVAHTALAAVGARLGPRPGLELVVADVTTYEPPRHLGAWHDRALLHFLVDSVDQSAYVEVASRTLLEGGVCVVACFAPDGPRHCSGLPVVRRDARALAELFGDRFELVATERAEHVTPWAASQPLTWVVLRRRSGA